MSPAPATARGSGDGLVDRIKVEKANRERKAPKGADKRASSRKKQEKKEAATSSNRDVQMKDDAADNGDDLFFVEDMDLNDSYNRRELFGARLSWKWLPTSFPTVFSQFFVRPKFWGLMVS